MKYLVLFSLLLIPFSLAYAEEFYFTHYNPTWYSYDCSLASPTTFTRDSPNDVTQFKYYNFIDDNSECFAVMFSFDLQSIEDITLDNATNTIKSRSLLLTDSSLSTSYTMLCDLYWFETNINTNEDSFTQSPTVLDNDFNCTLVNATLNNISERVYNWTASEISSLQTDITADDLFLHMMVFPVRNASMISDIDSNNYRWGLQNNFNELYMNGTGVECWQVKESALCNIRNDWWGGVGRALGSDYIGEWFYVLVFFPFPMSIFLITRNGTYAGFTGLSIMLAIQTISTTVFEIALSMIFISAGFAFYDILRKKLVE